MSICIHLLQCKQCCDFAISANKLSDDVFEARREVERLRTENDTLKVMLKHSTPNGDVERLRAALSKIAGYIPGSTSGDPVVELVRVAYDALHSEEGKCPE
jgi:FtsZ-binding cell division protein ZapB